MTTARPSFSGDSKPTRRGRFERFLLSVFGPASVGDLAAPLTYEPEVSASLCDKCGRPYDQHQRVHSSVTYLTCPEP